MKLNSYHDFVRGLLKATTDHAAPEAFLIADHSAIRRYGIGAVKPAPIPIFKHLRSGYLIRAKSVADLAAKAGIDPDGLQTTIDTYNTHARKGQDPEFNRGGNVYNRYVGDPMHEPNPCVGPIENGPFYAVNIYPGDLGTFAGLEDGRTRSRTAHRRFADRRPLCSRRRHGPYHGRRVYEWRRKFGSGTDIWLHRRRTFGGDIGLLKTPLQSGSPSTSSNIHRHR